MITVNKKNSVSAEAYRSIRTNLEYSSIDKKLKTIVVTSSEPGEGKSTVCSNLGYILAEGEKKVLILDSDLRKPSLHRKFRVSNEVGLTDLLVGKVKFSEVIKNIDENLDLITSGQKTPNPAEMVASETMGKLINKFKESYDYILIDTPPVLSINDARILATKCDGAIYVIKAGKTKNHIILNGYKELEKVKANLVGSVVNGVKDSNDKYYYYYGTN